MSDFLVPLQPTCSVDALEEQLKSRAAQASAVFHTDAAAYARTMDEVRELVGQLAMALEVEDQARIRALGEDERSVVAVRMN